jgi:hypothetical protein
MAEYLKTPVDLSNNIYDYVGVGDPTTPLANAATGSLYRKLDGVSGSTLWQKTATGWEALQGSSWNQATADGRYGQLAASNTWTAANSFSAANNQFKATGTDGSAYIQLFGIAGSGHKNWQIGKSVTLTNALEFRPSTTADGSTYTGAVVFTDTGSINLNGWLTGVVNRGVLIGNSFFGQQGSGYGEVGYNNSNGGGSANYLVADFASRIRFNAGAVSFQTAPSGSAGAAITFTERMLLTQLGALSVADAITQSSRTGGIASDFIIGSSPTGNTQLLLASSSVAGAVGQAYSSGNTFLTYNAQTVTKNVDSWQQSFSTLPSTKIQLTSGGIELHGAPASTATATNATFWGSIIMLLDKTGFIYLNDTTQSFFRPQYGSAPLDAKKWWHQILSDGTYRLRAVNDAETSGNNGLVITRSGATVSRFGFGGYLCPETYAGPGVVLGDVVARRAATTGVYYFGDSNTTYLYYDGTNFNLSGGGYFTYPSGIRANNFYINGGTATGSYFDGAVSTYGSINLVGVNSGYAGIRFQSIAHTLMSSGAGGVALGMYSGTDWMFYISDGADTAGNTTFWHKRQYFHVACSTLQTSGGIRFTTNTAATVKGYVYWDNAGNFGLLNGGSWAVRTTASGGELTGSWSATGNLTATDFVLSSDIQFKEKLAPIVRPLDVVDSISGFLFQYKNDPKRRRAGVSAQAVRDVLPEAVVENADGSLFVSYDSLVPLLIEAVKELRADIRALRAA